MMLSTQLSLRGGVMKSQVGCTTVRLVRENKSIKTIMIPRPSYQARLNQEHKLAQSKRCIIQWQSFISTIVYRLVLNNLEAAGAFSGSCRRILPLQINICIITSQWFVYLELRHASSVWAKLFFNKQALTFTNSLTTIDPLPWISISNCVWNSLVFSYLPSMSGVVCVVCPFTDDEKLKNIHVDLALLVWGPALLSTHAPLTP